MIKVKDRLSGNKEWTRLSIDSSGAAKSLQVCLQEDHESGDEPISSIIDDFQESSEDGQTDDCTDGVALELVGDPQTPGGLVEAVFLLDTEGRECRKG